MALVSQFIDRFDKNAPNAQQKQIMDITEKEAGAANVGRQRNKRA